MFIIRKSIFHIFLRFFIKANEVNFLENEISNLGFKLKKLASNTTH